MTPITPESLSEIGFHLVNRGNVQYFENGEARVIYTCGGCWQFCDIEGNVGNTILLSIEQIIAEINRPV